MPYYNRDPKRDHNFDNHPNQAIIMGLYSGRNGIQGYGDYLKFRASET